MNDPIREAFDAARRAGRIALVPFVTAGHPRLDLTPTIVKAIADAGADVIEIGVPFSDPLAEGPTIQKSSHDSLMGGSTVRSSIEAAKAARDLGADVPLALMGYYNPMLSLGIEKYCGMSAASGVSGLIAADLPAEEAGPLIDAAADAGMSVIPAGGPHVHRGARGSCVPAGRRVRLLCLGARRYRRPRRGFVKGARSRRDGPAAH